MRAAILFIAMMMTAAQNANAEDNDDRYLDVKWMGEQAILATMGALKIEISDEVSDGCWPNPRAARDAVELELRRAGLVVANDDDLAAIDRVFITGLGGSNGVVCAVGFQVEVLPVIWASVPNAGHTFLSISSVYDVVRILTGPQISMQDRLRSAATEAATEIALAIIRAREALFAKHPELEVFVKQ